MVKMMKSIMVLTFGLLICIHSFASEIDSSRSREGKHGVFVYGQDGEEGQPGSLDQDGGNGGNGSSWLWGPGGNGGNGGNCD